MIVLFIYIRENNLNAPKVGKLCYIYRMEYNKIIKFMLSKNS